MEPFHDPPATHTPGHIPKNQATLPLFPAGPRLEIKMEELESVFLPAKPQRGQ